MSYNTEFATLTYVSHSRRAFLFLWLRTSFIQFSFPFEVFSVQSVFAIYFILAYMMSVNDWDIYTGTCQARKRKPHYFTEWQKGETEVFEMPREHDIAKGFAAQAAYQQNSINVTKKQPSFLIFDLWHLSLLISQIFLRPLASWKVRCGVNLNFVPTLSCL